jgi:hypothetical protein
MVGKLVMKGEKSLEDVELYVDTLRNAAVHCLRIAEKSTPPALSTTTMSVRTGKTQYPPLPSLHNPSTHALDRLPQLSPPTPHRFAHRLPRLREGCPLDLRHPILGIHYRAQ